MKEYRPHDEGTYVAYSTPGKQIVRFAIVNDTTVIFAIFAANSLDAGDLSGPMIQRQVLHHQFDHEGWECSRMLDLLDQSEDLYFDRVSQIGMDRWSRCLIPGFDGALFSREWKDALWARFFTAAPQ